MHRHLLLSLFAQPPELGQGYLPEFNLAARQTLNSPKPSQPANTPGAPLPEGARKPVPGLEKTMTAKADVIGWLKDSHDAVRRVYPQADLHKPLKFLNRDATAEGVFLRLLVHDHEHMGQMIAYARSIGVKPPWSE